MKDADEHGVVAIEESGGISFEPMKAGIPAKCPKCQRVFANHWGLRVHDIRAHSNRNWDTSKNFKHHNLKDSHGKPRKAGWKPRARAHQAVWREQRRAYMKKWNEKRKLELAASRNGGNQVTPGLNQALAEVRSTPDITGEAAKAILVAASVLRAVITGQKIGQ